MNDTNQERKLQSLIEKISAGDGDYNNNIKKLEAFGDASLIALLDARPKHEKDKRDFRDSLQDLQGAFIKIAQNNMSKAGELLEIELRNPENTSNSNRVQFLVDCMCQIYHEDLLPVLSLGIKNKDQFVRWQCAESLRKSADPKALPILEKALSDRAELVKTCAISAMSEFGTKEYIPKLIKITKAKNQLMADQARDAIAEIQSREI